MKMPFIKFYVRDWMGDPQLRMCSIAARGLWFEMICLMHGAKRCGFLETQAGKPLTDDETSRLTGTFKGDLYRSSSTDDGFERFWSSYPRKIGKQAAKNAWRKAKGKPKVDIIIEVVNQQKQTEQWQKDNGQFIPHPATWINQGRWDDALTTEIEKPRYFAEG